MHLVGAKIFPVTELKRIEKRHRAEMLGNIEQEFPNKENESHTSDIMNINTLQVPRMVIKDKLFILHLLSYSVLHTMLPVGTKGLP